MADDIEAAFREIEARTSEATRKIRAGFGLPLEPRRPRKTRRGASAARNAAISAWEDAGRPPCGICGTSIARDEPVDVDHIRLYAVKQDHEPGNLRVVHRICNMLSGPAGQIALMVKYYRTEDIPRLGAGPWWIGGEARHGVTGIWRLDPAASSDLGRLVIARMRGELSFVSTDKSGRHYGKRVDVTASYRAGKLLTDESVGGSPERK